MNSRTYLFYIQDFDQPKSLTLALLKLLANYGKLNKSINKDCDIYRLSFINDKFSMQIIFLYPYLDRNIPFYNVYDTFKVSSGLNKEVFMFIDRIDA